MLKKEIEIGKVYLAKISGRLSPVRILSFSHYNSRHWITENIRTKRQVVIRSAAKLRAELEPVFVNNVRKWRMLKKGIK